MGITRCVDLTQGEMLCVAAVCLSAPHGGTGLGRRLAALASLVRSGMTRERLPPPPPQARPAAERPSWLATLFRPEPLPEAPPRPPRAGRSLLAAVLAPEPLPLDPVAPRPPRRRWIAFLLAPDRLDGPGGAGPEVH